MDPHKTIRHLINSGKKSQAIELIEQQYALNDTLCDGFTVIGSMRREIQDWQGAYAFMRRDFELGRMSWGWQLRYAEVLVEMGQDDAATELVARIYAQQPSATDGYARLGWAKTRTQDWQTAYTWMNKDHSAGRMSPVWEVHFSRLAFRHIEPICRKLYSLGFTERPLEELEKILRTHADGEVRASAARELARWLILKKTATDYRTALGYIDTARKHTSEREFRATLTTLELLCHYFLNQFTAGHAAYERSLQANEVTPNVKLAWANCHTSPEARMACINAVLAHYAIPPVTLLPNADQPLYDRLTVAPPLPKVYDGPKVTVLIAVYQSAAMLPTALRSLQEQTWQNLEILVIDDASPTPETCAVAERFAASDPRIRVIRMETNCGAYVARNYGLSVATGDYVTLHDADDWSHPLKIATQVSFMEAHPEIMACTSEQARATSELVFNTLNSLCNFIRPNISSLLFRRQTVVEAIGYWDSVRFGADSQFIPRIRKHFGNHSYRALSTGPLSFQRNSSNSATTDDYFGFNGFFYGARRLYEAASDDWLRHTDRVFINLETTQRPFFAPEPMRPRRCASQSGYQHFDIVLASDFRFPGGTTGSNAETIKANQRLGLKTGLVELYNYNFPPHQPMNDKIRALIDGDTVELLCYGERIACDILIIRQPMCFNYPQRYIPDIQAGSVRVIINQTPRRDYSATGEVVYDLLACRDNLHTMFGDPGIWHPNSPIVRNALNEHHAEQLAAIALSEDNWTNIIDTREWRRGCRPNPAGRPIRICRHSRDAYVKWPADRATVLKAYPDDPEFEIHVLGGGSTPATLLGGPLPTNWQVHGFGEVQPKLFLAEQDLFVYFTHPDWIEAFSRAILEAMSVGLPVILPVGVVYEALFKDAVIYATPDEVANLCRQLMRDSAMYERQVQRAFEWVQQFDYASHARRLERIMNRKLVI